MGLLAQRQAFQSTLALSYDAALTREFFFALRLSSLVHYDELRLKWRSILAGKPNYSTGLMSIASLLDLKSDAAQTSSIRFDHDINMKEWVENEHRKIH